jgi:hypothetical protein
LLGKCEGDGDRSRHADVLDLVVEVAAEEPVLAEDDLARAHDPDLLVLLQAGEVIRLLRPAFPQEEGRFRVVVIGVLDLLRSAETRPAAV